MSQFVPSEIRMNVLSYVPSDDAEGANDGLRVSADDLIGEMILLGLSPATIIANERERRRRITHLRGTMGSKIYALLPLIPWLVKIFKDAINELGFGTIMPCALLLLLDTSGFNTHEIFSDFVELDELLHYGRKIPKDDEYVPEHTSFKYRHTN